MNAKHWRTALAGLVCSALATVAWAAPPQTTQKPAYQPVQRQAARQAATKPTVKKEMVTLEIRGADCQKDAASLDAALAMHAIRAKLQPSTEKPNQVEVSINRNMDLGAVGEAVMKTNTQDKAKYPPSLDLVLYGKFDKDSAKKATEALAKVKGVDAQNSSANISAGELNIRLNGRAKVSANQLYRAHHDAGIQTQFVRHNA
jgi:hypothetical protein